MTTNNMEARREAFEKLFPVPYYITWHTDRLGYYSIHRDSTRKRGAENYDAKWQGYNAALDSICVELPQGFTHHGGEDCTKYVIDADEVVEALTAAGVPYK